MIKDTLINKISTKEAVIGVIGLGYVGLPLSLRFCESGFKVIGFDTDPVKKKKIDRGESYISYISPETIKEATTKGLEATSDFSRITHVDAIILCVPTPLNAYKEPNLEYIRSSMDSIGPYLQKGQVVALESTTYPGTTEEIIFPVVQEANLTPGEDLFVLYSPEREDPANSRYSTGNIPKLCAGATPACLEVGLALYGSSIEKVVPVDSLKVAEMAKLLENIHRAVNIGLVNEMKIVADSMDIDIHDVIQAAATKPFGFTPYYPGPGLGGHCIPIDPFYLTWKAREYGINTRFIELAGEINTRMPDYVIGKLTEALNDSKQSLKGSHILVLGASYKKNIDDTRESPSLEIMDKLQAKGAIVRYSDPHIPELLPTRKYRLDLVNTPLTVENVRQADAVMLITDHDGFDYDLILENAKVVIDTRGRYDKQAGNVVKA